MKTAAIAFRMDEELKNQLEVTLNEIGLPMSSAFTVFAKAVVRTGAIPFDLVADPFYWAENQKELVRRIEEKESGRSKARQVVKTMDELEEIVYG